MLFLLVHFCSTYRHGAYRGTARTLPIQSLVLGSDKKQQCHVELVRGAELRSQTRLTKSESEFNTVSREFT